MKERISNGKISIEVENLGAELQSLFDITSRKEFLWQGDSKWWPRKAPVLFPIVGKLNNNMYSVNGKQFSLPQHGFARDRNFELAEKTSTLLIFRLKSSEETKNIYPFDFELLIGYELKGRVLEITYTLVNTGNEQLFFSIGAHPGFICPIDQNKNFTDYFLEFEKEETLDRYLLEDGNFTGQTERVMTNTRILQLNEELFKKDAIVFKNMKSSYLILKNQNSETRLKFSFKNFPYFGIWTKPGAPFLCLEPWCGIADNKNADGELKNKEGIDKLSPDTKFVRSYSIEI